MKYYVAENGQPQGPYSIDELLAKNIPPTTLVWNDTMPEWQKADSVPELASILYGASTPRISYTQPEPPGQMPPTWLAQSILVTLFCCIPFGIVAIIKASNVESRWRMGDYLGAQQASNQAKTWTLVAFLCGLGGILLYMLFLAFAIFGTIA